MRSGIPSVRASARSLGSGSGIGERARCMDREGMVLPVQNRSMMKPDPSKALRCIPSLDAFLRRESLAAIPRAVAYRESPVPASV